MSCYWALCDAFLRRVIQLGNSACQQEKRVCWWTSFLEQWRNIPLFYAKLKRVRDTFLAKNCSILSAMKSWPVFSHKIKLTWFSSWKTEAGYEVQSFFILWTFDTSMKNWLWKIFFQKLLCFGMKPSNLKRPTFCRFILIQFRDQLNRVYSWKFAWNGNWPSGLDGWDGDSRLRGQRVWLPLKVMAVKAFLFFA